MKSIVTRCFICVVWILCSFGLLGESYHQQHLDDEVENDYEKENGIDAAIQSKHYIDTYPVDTDKDTKTPVVDINSGPLSLKIRFNSHSSNIIPIQNHFGSHGKVKKSKSIDQPDILIHSVKKPVIQEIKEVITPYRKRIQQVKPVKEKLETIVATGHGHTGKHYGSKIMMMAVIERI
ncbi:hypothetical protein SSS_03893 [Sarcoptes scabiei]|uniref:Uncharacterized protein n=1 Tax=Sarcoptes scabiei TaxID=52283 RepID=A0A834VD24_SARSC|nr:hypothetical protein SSS_03893 [Sarcoptes scabiei]